MWKKVQSSNISKVRYKKGTLKVKFHRGGEYQYSEVPKAEYEGLLSADSKGKYFNKSIKGVYAFEKIEKSKSMVSKIKDYLRSSNVGI